MIRQGILFDNADIQVMAVTLHLVELLHQGLVVPRQNVVHGALFQTYAVANTTVTYVIPSANSRVSYNVVHEALFQVLTDLRQCNQTNDCAYAINSHALICGVTDCCS